MYSNFFCKPLTKHRLSLLKIFMYRSFFKIVSLTKLFSNPSTLFIFSIIKLPQCKRSHFIESIALMFFLRTLSLIPEMTDNLLYENL